MWEKAALALTGTGIFSPAIMHDPATGRVAVYYGCADTVTGLAFGYIPEIIDFTKQNSIL